MTSIFDVYVCMHYIHATNLYNATHPDRCCAQPSSSVTKERSLSTLSALVRSEANSSCWASVLEISANEAWRSIESVLKESVTIDTIATARRFTSYLVLSRLSSAFTNKTNYSTCASTHRSWLTQNYYF